MAQKYIINLNNDEKAGLVTLFKFDGTIETILPTLDQSQAINVRSARVGCTRWLGCFQFSIAELNLSWIDGLTLPIFSQSSQNCASWLSLVN